MSDINIQERGFPLTMLLGPCERYKTGLVNMFTTTPFLCNALKEEEEFDILKCPETTKQYTVLLPKTLPQLQHDEPLEWLYLDEKPVLIYPFSKYNLKLVCTSIITVLGLLSFISA